MSTMYSKSDVNRPSTYEERELWFKEFPISAEGIPVNDHVRGLIQFLFRHAREWWKVEDLASRLHMHRDHVSSICRSLFMLELLDQDYEAGSMFRYRLGTPNLEIQTKLETALLPQDID